MPRFKNLYSFLCLTIMAILLSSCSESTPPAAETKAVAAAPVVQSAPPEGRLGNAVAPTLYQLELKNQS